MINLLWLYNMLGAMSKKETGIFALLVGLLCGMLISIFIEYSISVGKLESIINTSCLATRPSIVSISFFGKRIKIQCNSGEVHHYNLWILNRNGSNQDDSGK